MLKETDHMRHLKTTIQLLGVTLSCLMTGTMALAGDLPPLVTPLAGMNFVPMNLNDTSGQGVMIHVIFGDLKKKGPVAFVARLPAGYSAGWHAHSSDSYLVSIQGSYLEWRHGEPEGKPAGAGATVFVPAKEPHNNRCDKAGGPCLNYAYWPNGFDVEKE